MGRQQNFTIDVDETFSIGTDTYFTSIPDGSAYGVAFEDDMETGYFYAFLVAGEGIIQDALHIYNVKDVVFRDQPCKLRMMWTQDRKIVSLLINDYCHAVFDFEKREGYCRNGHPENVGDWNQQPSRVLTDELILQIFPDE